MALKNKTILLLFLGITFSLLFALVGCSGNNTDNSDSNPKITYTNISTVEELVALSNQSGNYKLINNIDISGNSWTPIDGFSGLLEGDNYEIQGLTISGNTKNVGLFSTLKGTVQNLKLTAVNITATGDAGTAGSICGTNEGTISAVSVGGTINTPYYSNVGGICGISNSGKINRNANTININGYENVGGVVGYYNFPKDANCDGNTNNGEISGKNFVGGIVGRLRGVSPGTSSHKSSSFTNNSNLNSISGNGNYVGGLIGYQSSADYNDWGTHYYTYLTISSCSNSGVVNGEECSGGIIGYADKLTELTSSINTANITGTNYVGGYVGQAVGTAIKIATNNNVITGKGYIGGIAGYCGNLTDCTNNGSINSLAPIVQDSDSRAYVGGIAGYATLINDCTNNAAITVTTGGSYVGGIVGYLMVSKNNTCNKNINNGEIAGKHCVGGIVGQLQCVQPGTSSNGIVNFTNNESTKNISGSGNYVGGLIGYQFSDEYNDWGTRYYTYLTVSNCRNNGNVIGVNYVGGIIAYGLYCVKTEAVWGSNSNLGTVAGDNSGDLYGYLK